MIFRRTTASELDQVLPLFVTDAACDLTAELFMTRITSGEYRPEWTWIGQESPGAKPAAIAFWWATPHAAEPAALDGIYVDEPAGGAAARTELAVDLLAAAHAAFARTGLARPPAYHIFLPPDWRDRPAAVAALTWREEAARRAGLTATLERLRYEWTPQAGLPPSPARLRFAAEPDDEVFVDLFRRVLTGTLDATSREQAGLAGAAAQARKDVAFYRDQMQGDRTWWRVALAPDGQPAGFGLPSRSMAFPVVGYLGVLPEYRGHGYVDEILAEVTRILATEAGATAIHADTDLGNQPMAAAFERLGYRNFGRRLVLSAPPAPKDTSG
jgi:ribosomal protein S18 acetylase RimI-like enzyme